MVKYLFGLIESCLFRDHVRTLPQPPRHRASGFPGRQTPGEGAEPHLQDRSQEDRDPSQDEDKGAGDPLFPGGEEHSQVDWETLHDHYSAPALCGHIKVISEALASALFPHSRE